MDGILVKKFNSQVHASDNRGITWPYECSSKTPLHVAHERAIYRDSFIGDRKNLIGP
jgi:hypothetical protein